MSTYDMLNLMTSATGQQQCLLGFHAWVPWLTVTNDDGTVRFYTTWCSRGGCDHVEQWDPA